MKRRSRHFLEMLCLVLALCFTLCTIPLSANEEAAGGETVQIVVAKKDILKGRMVTDQVIEVVTVKNFNLPTNYISKTEEVLEKYAKVDIYAGEYISFEQVSSKKVLSVSSDTLVKPVEESNEKYVVVTDYVIPNSGKDVTGSLQELINDNPNRTIYFPDGEYIISSPLFTPAVANKSVSLQLSDGAIIKAAKTWKTGKFGTNTINSLICSGGDSPVNDIDSVGSYYSIKGGILDGNGKADGIELVSGRETQVRNICMRNVNRGITVADGANNHSSDMDFEDITIYGTGKPNSIGVYVVGYDNTFSNIRIYNTGVAIRDTSGGNLYKNIYAVNDLDKISVYATTVAFDFSNSGSRWMSQCYAENFSTAYLLNSTVKIWDCTAKWTSAACTRQVAVSSSTPTPALSGIRAEFFGGIEDSHMFKITTGSECKVIEGCMYDSDLCKNGFNSNFIMTPIIDHKS